MANQIVVEMTGQEAKLWQSLQKVCTQQTKVEGGFKKIGTAAGAAGTKATTASDKMTKAGSAGTKAFGAGAGSQIAAFGASFAGVGTAVSLVTKCLNDMAQAGAEAAERAKQSIAGMGELAQLVQTPEQFAEITAESRAAYGTGFGGSLSEAAKLVFQLKSAGFEKSDRDLFVEMGSVGHTKDPSEMVGSLVAFRTAMGAEETGSVRDMVNKAIAAAGTTTVGASEMLMAGVKPSGAAATLGLSDEELFALLGIGTKQVKDPRVASTMADAFLSAVAANPEFEGKGMSLKEIVQTIQAKGLKRGELQTLTGGIRGIKGYEFLVKDMAGYDALLGGVGAAQAENPLAGQMKVAATDPSLKAAMDAIAASHQEELSAEDLGTAKNRADKLLDDYAVKRRKEGGGFLSTGGLSAEWDIIATRMQAGAKRFIQRDEAWVAAHEDGLAGFAPEMRGDLMAMAMGRERFQAGQRVLGLAEPYARDLQSGLGLAMPTPPAAPAPENIHDFADLGEKFERATENLVDAGRDAGRGPTLVPPNVDR